MNLRMPLTIDRLGQRGEGVSHTDEGVVFTPYALPGETILAEVDGERGALVEVVKPSPDRIPSFCPHFTVCGGCAVQTLAPAPYGAWKRGLLIAALDHAGLRPEVEPMIDAHGEGRRRVTFHARFDRDALGRVQTVVGFMRARSHEITPLEACPILAPGLAQALPAARAVSQMLNQLGKPLDIVITASLEGLDVDVRGTGKLSFEIEQAVIGLAAKLDLARLVLEGVGSARKVLDLFSGVGTFALRLAEKATVVAVEAEAHALASLEKAAHSTQGLRSLTTEKRDLVRRPLLRHELTPFDAVVFDPPRSGAEEQAREIAASGLKTAVAVSCNAQTFARDAKILVDGGFRIERITPVDQFRHSAHIEVVGLFRREPVKTKRRGRLLG